MKCRIYPILIIINGNLKTSREFYLRIKKNSFKRSNSFSIDEANAHGII